MPLSSNLNEAQLKEWYSRFTKTLREKANIDVTNKTDLARVKNYAIDRWDVDDMDAVQIHEPTYAFMPHDGNRCLVQPLSNVPFETHKEWLLNNLQVKPDINHIRSLYNMSRAGTLTFTAPGALPKDMQQIYTDEHGNIFTSMPLLWYGNEDPNVSQDLSVPTKGQMPDFPDRVVPVPNPDDYGRPEEPQLPDPPENLHPGFFSWLGHIFGLYTDYSELKDYEEEISTFAERHQEWENTRDQYLQNPEYLEALRRREQFVQTVTNIQAKPLGILLGIAGGHQNLLLQRDGQQDIPREHRFRTIINEETLFLQAEHEKTPMGQVAKGLEELKALADRIKYPRKAVDGVLGIDSYPDNVAEMRLLNIYNKGEFKRDVKQVPQHHIKESDYSDKQAYWDAGNKWLKEIEVLASMAGLAAMCDPSVSGNPPMPGCSAQETAEQNFSLILSNLFTTGRPGSQEQMKFVAPARDKAHAALLAFNDDGKPEELGKLMGNGLRQMCREAACLSDLNTKTSINTLYLLDRMMENVESRPELLQNIGLTQEELKEVQANRAIYKVLRDGIEARMALAEHALYKRTLNEKELQQVATNILYADLITDNVKDSHTKETQVMYEDLSYQKAQQILVEYGNVETLKSEAETAKANKDSTYKAKEAAYQNALKWTSIANMTRNIRDLRRPPHEIGLKLLNPDHVAASKQALAKACGVEQIVNMEREGLGNLARSMISFKNVFAAKPNLVAPAPENAPVQNQLQQEVNANEHRQGGNENELQQNGPNV